MSLPPPPRKTPPKKRSIHDKRVKAARGMVAQFSWTLIKVGVMGTIWALTLVSVLILWFSQDLPDLNHLKAGVRNPSVVIQDQQGNVIETYGHLYEDVLSINDLPPYVPQALMAVEDRRFYYHFGVDVMGLIRAAYTNYKAQRVVQGGSTLTQQLAKNILMSAGNYDINDRSMKRKIQELILAFWLEFKFKKDEILTLYLNRVYFGSATYGIDAAAHKYFNKSARDLTVFESAVIAGLLKAPSKYSPAHHPQRAIERAKVVLQLMVEAGYLRDGQAYLEQGSQQLKDLHQEKIPGRKFFTDWINESIPSMIGRVNKDIVVITTLNPPMQRHAEQICREHIDMMGVELKASEVAFVAISPDGAVRAMVGGYDYARSQFNRAVHVRQPGSAFKIAVYLSALESGMTPDTMIADTPITIGKWSPKNYKWVSRGEIDLRTAMAHSVNTVSVRITQQVTLQKLIETARRLGITSGLSEDWSLCLGTCETTLLEMATAYATFANQGNEVWPYGILEIRDKEGNILYQREDAAKRVIVAPQIVTYMRQLLRGVVENGSGRAANIDPSVSGKTGSNEDRDAWFFGYRETLPEAMSDVQGFTNVTVGVWVGNDDNKPMAKQSTGGRLPARIAAAFLKGENFKDEKAGKKSASKKVNAVLTLEDVLSD